MNKYNKDVRLIPEVTSNEFPTEVPNGFIIGDYSISTHLSLYFFYFGEVLGERGEDVLRNSYKKVIYAIGKRGKEEKVCKMKRKRRKKRRRRRNKRSPSAKCKAMQI